MGLPRSMIWKLTDGITLGPGDTRFSIYPSEPNSNPPVLFSQPGRQQFLCQYLSVSAVLNAFVTHGITYAPAYANRRTTACRCRPLRRVTHCTRTLAT